MKALVNAADALDTVALSPSRAARHAVKKSNERESHIGAEFSSRSEPESWHPKLARRWVIARQR